MVKAVIGFVLSIVFGVNALTNLFPFDADRLPAFIGFSVLSLLLAALSWSEIKDNLRESDKAAEEYDKNLKLEQTKKELLGETPHKYLDVKYLGGAGNRLIESGIYSFGVMKEKIRFLTKNNETWDIDFSEVVEIEVGGAGTTTTNAGISGGGFGLEGFIKGAITAAVINAATTKSTTNTFLRIKTTNGEIFLHTSMCEPAELRIILSPLSVALAKSVNRSGTTGVADELSKLNELKKSGVISDEEFESAKKKLLM